MNEYTQLASALFGAVEGDDFFAGYWRKKPVYRRGKAENFDTLFSIADFKSTLFGDMTERLPAMRSEPVTRQDVLQTSARRAPIALKAYYNTPGGRGGEIPNVPHNQAMALFDAGLTLCASGLERNSEQLTAFVAAVREQAGYASDILINAYYSPHGQGFNWHYDCQHVFVLQLDGEKTWQFSDRIAFNDPLINLPLELTAQPAVADALSQLGIDLVLPSEASIIEKTLAPGDTLYLPPGTWHRASAQGQSFALSLTLVPLAFSELLRTLIGYLTLRRELWRKELNAGPCSSLTDRPLPAQQGELLRECLAEAQQLLAGTTPEELLDTCARIRRSPMMALAIRELSNRN